MKRIGLGTILSIGLNLFLLYWLFSTYEADQNFQAYVNTTVGPLSPFIVLTIGVGGGSGLGYFLLKRKHSDQSIAARIQKAKSFRPAFRPISTVASPSSALSKNLPTGVPPSPASKHTAYAVPSLAKTPSQTISRGGTTPSWSSGARTPPLGSSSAPKQDSFLKPSPSTSPPLKTDLTRTPQALQSPIPRSETAERLIPPKPQGDTLTRPDTPTPWKQEPASLGGGQADSSPIFQRPGLDLSARQDSATIGRTGPQPSPSPQPSQLPGSKWQPPESKTDTGIWTDSSKSPVPPVPSKWTPPAGPPSPQGQAPGPPNVPPRPGGIPQRPPIPGQQMGPRPFVYQGPPRPGQPGPMGVPGPFRPDPNRPPPGMGGQQRPPLPQPRPPPGLAGPMPQPWTPARQPQERKEPPSPGGQDRPSPSQSGAGSPPSAQKGSGEAGGGGEMDWDTALDTILKTLRKDRVGDKQ